MVLTEPRQLQPIDLALPEIGDDDGLLRVEACGLCGTDHEQYTGALALGFPFVPGHESVGVIEAVGVRAVRGDYRQCASHGLLDMYGFGPVSRAPGLWGGYATHQYLAPDTLLVPVPDGLDPVVATLFNPLGAGIRWGVTVPGTSAGDVVAVLGPGIRGLSTLVAAREAGAGFVMVTGAGERDAERLAIVKAFGADLTVDVSQDDPVAQLRHAAGGLADIVVDVTANAPDAFVQALKLARPGGTVVVAGTRGATPIGGFSPDRIVSKELRVLGALGVDTPAYTAALDLLASGRYAFGELPRRTVGLDGVEGLLRAMAGESASSPPMHGVVVPG
jgi:alcohol dehydrogenase